MCRGRWGRWPGHTLDGRGGTTGCPEVTTTRDRLTPGASLLHLDSVFILAASLPPSTSPGKLRFRHFLGVFSRIRGMVEAMNPYLHRVL